VEGGGEIWFKEGVKWTKGDGDKIIFLVGVILGWLEGVY